MRRGFTVTGGCSDAGVGGGNGGSSRSFGCAFTFACQVIVAAGRPPDSFPVMDGGKEGGRGALVFWNVASSCKPGSFVLKRLRDVLGNSCFLTFQALGTNPDRQGLRTYAPRSQWILNNVQFPNLGFRINY